MKATKEQESPPTIKEIFNCAPSRDPSTVSEVNRAEWTDGRLMKEFVRSIFICSDLVSGAKIPADSCKLKFLQQVFESPQMLPTCFRVSLENANVIFCPATLNIYFIPRRTRERKESHQRRTSEWR